MVRILITILYDVLYVLMTLLIVQVVLDNFLRIKESSPAMRVLKFIQRLTNPLLAPIRLLLPVKSTRGWDLSPLFAMLIIYFLRNLLNQMR